MKTICLNPKVDGKQPSLNDRVYSTKGVSMAITTTPFFMGGVMDRCVKLGDLDSPKFNEMTARVYDTNGLAPTSQTCGGGGHETKIGENMPELRIRKLTEGECMRLMGFEGKDTEACRKAGLTKTNIYHQSGDSIVTAVLMGIFGELFDPDYRKKIEDYCEKLAKEKTP